MRRRRAAGQPARHLRAPLIEEAGESWYQFRIVAASQAQLEPVCHSAKVGRERAFTFCIALLRWNFIVASAMPILPAIWLLKATARDLNHDLALRGALRFEALPGGNERLFVLPSSRLRRR